MWIVFISNIREGNSLRAEIFVYCTGALTDCCEGEIELQVEK